MNSFKTLLSIIVFIFLNLAIYFEAIANHSMGGELTYTCIGNNHYKLRFVFYRDCIGVSAPDSLEIDYLSSCYPTRIQTYLHFLPNYPVQISPLCSSQVSICNGGSFLGIEKWVYEGDVSLPGSCSDWTFSHLESARSYANTTIPSGQSLFIYALLNNTNGFCNNSPVFTNDPIPLICEGNQYCLPSFVTEPDGDSLYFKRITPLIGTTILDSITYNTNYSVTNPLTTQLPITFSNQTGEMCLMPVVANEVSPIAIIISEYRNGILIGRVERDMQIAVMQCNNHPPILNGINGLLNFSMDVCAGQQNCLFITGTDSDILDSTLIAWDGSIPGLMSHNTSGKRDTLLFCWTPSDSDTLINPHCFYASISDNYCPYISTTYQPFCLNVLPNQNCNVGISETETEYDFSIFPQPANNDIIFKFEKIPPNGILSIYTMLGNLVIKIPVKENLTRIETEKYANGTYLAVTIDENGLVKCRRKVLIFK